MPGSMKEPLSHTSCRFGRDLNPGRFVSSPSPSHHCLNKLFEVLPAAAFLADAGVCCCAFFGEKVLCRASFFLMFELDFGVSTFLLGDGLLGDETANLEPGGYSHLKKDKEMKLTCVRIDILVPLGCVDKE
jgi:hypothetical protein